MMTDIYLNLLALTITYLTALNKYWPDYFYQYYVPEGTNKKTNILQTGHHLLLTRQTNKKSTTECLKIMETKIWAKSKTGDAEISLSQHINDVLAVSRCLCPNNVKSETLRELIKIVIEYHDAGKVLPHFQRKTLGNSDYEPFEVYTHIPHSLLSALLVDAQKLQERLSVLFDDQSKVETYTKYILSAIAYHHWRENFFDMVEGYTDIFDRLKKLVSDEKKWKN